MEQQIPDIVEVEGALWNTKFLQQIGGSYGVLFPKSLAEFLCIKVHTKPLVLVRFENGVMLVKPVTEDILKLFPKPSPPASAQE